MAKSVSQRVLAVAIEVVAENLSTHIATHKMSRRAETYVRQEVLKLQSYADVIAKR